MSTFGKNIKWERRAAEPLKTDKREFWVWIKAKALKEYSAAAWLVAAADRSISAKGVQLLRSGNCAWEAAAAALGDALTVVPYNSVVSFRIGDTTFLSRINAKNQSGGIRLLNADNKAIAGSEMFKYANETILKMKIKLSGVAYPPDGFNEVAIFKDLDGICSSELDVSRSLPTRVGK